MTFSKSTVLPSLKNNQTRLLGIDYGERHIGLAISDLSWTLTRALPIVDIKKTKIFPFIKELIEKEQIVGIVIGYPVHMSGEAGDLCKRVHTFSQKLSAHIKGLPIIKFDERMTSLLAENHMIGHDISRAKRAQKIDSVSACFILQGMLDYLRNA